MRKKKYHSKEKCLGNIEFTVLSIFSVYSILLILLIFFLFLGLLSSCKSKNNSNFDFTNSEDAVLSYRCFLQDIKNTKTTNADDYLHKILNWREINDTVYNFLAKDSVFAKYHNIATDFFLIHDSITTEFVRLTETWNVKYEDLIKIKYNSSKFISRKDLIDTKKEAETFFSKLDASPVSLCDKKSILKRYRYFLKQTYDTGIKNKDELLHFIQQEDFLFRTFLVHLYEMQNESLTDITDITEKICNNIFTTAKKGSIPAKDALVYMSARTSRRLLQNSEECLKQLNQYNFSNKQQYDAYVWMIIQPFISIDDLAIAMMTKKCNDNFDNIIKQISTSKKFANCFDVSLQQLNNKLPEQLLKLYVLTYK